MTPTSPPDRWRDGENYDRNRRTEKRLDDLDGKVESLAQELRRDFIMRRDLEQMLENVEERYAPVVKIVYFIAAGVGFAVVAAFVKLVIK